jgi:hypothetical protein
MIPYITAVSTTHAAFAAAGAWGVGDVGKAVAAVGVGVGLAVAFHWGPRACSRKRAMKQQQQQQKGDKAAAEGGRQQFRYAFDKCTGLDRVGVGLAVAFHWRPRACSSNAAVKQQQKEGQGSSRRGKAVLRYECGECTGPNRGGSTQCTYHML